MTTGYRRHYGPVKKPPQSITLTGNHSGVGKGVGTVRGDPARQFYEKDSLGPKVGPIISARDKQYRRMRSFMNTSKQFLAGMMLAASSAASAYAISSYRLTDLGNLGGQSFAHGLNDKDQVVGYAELNGSDTAFLWQQSTGMVSLGTLPGGNQSWASSINNAGQIVGSSYGQGGPISLTTVLEHLPRFFFWQPGSGMIDIGAGTNATVMAFGMNQQGQIFGESSLGGFIYSAAAGFTLAEVPGTSVDEILALNSRGQMVIPDFSNHDIGMVFYSPGQGVFPIRNSNSAEWDVPTIAGMNEQGTVIGTMPTYIEGIEGSPGGTLLQAFIWNQAGGMTVLTPDPNDASWANGINNLGQVVGKARLNGQPIFPFLYENGTMYNLMSYLDDTAAGWSNLNLTAINNNGAIVGYGTFNGQIEAFLLTPNGSSITSTPEPTLLPLLLPTLLLSRLKSKQTS